MSNIDGETANRKARESEGEASGAGLSAHAPPEPESRSKQRASGVCVERETGGERRRCFRLSKL